MSRFLFLLIFYVFSFSAKAQYEKLLICGCKWDKIAIIDKTTKKIEWIHKLLPEEDCNDIEKTKDGNILYAYRGGARLIDLNHKEIWDYKVCKDEELYTATQQADGNFLLAVCGNPSRIVELDSLGKEINVIEFNTCIPKIHNQFRQILKLKNETFLIPLMGKGEIVVMNTKGVFEKRIKCGGTPFSILPVSFNRYLVSCGDGHNLVEVDMEKGAIVRVIDSNILHGSKIYFVAEAIGYKNGNILFCNWNGHTNDKTQPLLIEMDDEQNIVWTLDKSDEILNISSVYSYYE